MLVDFLTEGQKQRSYLLFRYHRPVQDGGSNAADA
jgi:hypothetical protein